MYSSGELDAENGDLLVKRTTQSQRRREVRGLRTGHAQDKSVLRAAGGGNVQATRNAQLKLREVAGLREKRIWMLVLKAAGTIRRVLPGWMRMVRGSLLAVMASGLLYLVGIKSNRTRCRADRAVEDGYRKDSDDDSGPIGFPFHFHS